MRPKPRWLIAPENLAFTLPIVRSPMNPTLVLDLTETLKEYLPVSELHELADLFDVPLPDNESERPYLQISKELIGNPNVGNNARFLSSLLDLSLNRSREGISNTKWAKQDYHSEMFNKISRLQSSIDATGISEEIAVPESSPFTAKSEVRDMLDRAVTTVILVDQYIGVRTLDCLRGVAEPILVLTGTQRQSLEDGFLRSLADFKIEGHKVEIRKHAKLHDRYLIFNERCWLIGGSLKDAGKKTFSMIEVVDTKQAIVTAVEQKWKESEPIAEES